MTTSNDPSSHGISCMSPTRTSASGLRSVAIATSRAEASMPAHLAPRAAASSMASPAPHATSSTRSAAPMPSCWCRATYSRQLAGSLNVAKSTARRPHPSSTRRHATRPDPLPRPCAPSCPDHDRCVRRDGCDSAAVRPAHRAGAAQRRGEVGELAQERPGVSRIDDLLDAERPRGAERRADPVHPLVDLGPQRDRVVRDASSSAR